MELHNPELERIVIGTVLARGNFSTDDRRLSTLDFFSERNVKLWGKMVEIDEDGEELNPIEIHRRCLQEWPMFDATISEISGYATGVPATVRPKDIATLRSLALARRLQKQFAAASTRLEHEPDVSIVINELEDALLKIRTTHDLGNGSAKTLQAVLENDVFPRIDKFVAGDTVKIPFGFNALDEAINGGVGLGELVLLGAKPKSGKSFLTLQIATYHALMNIPALIVSREMLNFENGFRFLAQRTKYSNSIFRPNLLAHTAEDLKVRAREHFDLPLYFDDRMKKVSEFRREIKALKESVGLTTVFVDYAQLVRPATKKQNRSDELEAVYYDLKEMAQDLEIVVYLLSQFNREGIKSVRPTMANFDGSSAAEKAGNLILIWELEKQWSEISDGRLGKLWIEAGRNVATDEFDVIFHGKHGLFSFENKLPGM